MGTPGDKSKLGKIVPSQGEPERESPPPVTTAETAAATPDISQGPSASTMGVVSRLPQFETFTTLSVSPSLPHAISKPETYHQHLEQPTIEDYYAQSKFYPSVSETLQTLYPIDPQKPRTFPSPIDQPGPSGLQTPKVRPSTSLGKVKKKKPEKPAGAKSHSCSVCQKSFGSSDKLSKHQQSHAGATPFKCDHCKKSFTSKFKLVRHSLIHSDRKPFSCTVCERTFHRKDHLKNHIKVHSPSKQVYECEKEGCTKQYTSLLSYRKHLAVHAAESGNLTCLICNASFDSKEDILYHLKIHAGSRTVKNPNEKKFTCDYCERRFFTKKDVRRHLVVHTGMRDFLCQFCPQRFGRKDHLVRHIKKSHNKKYSEESTSATATTITPKTETITQDPSESSDYPEIKEEEEFLETKMVFSDIELGDAQEFDPDVKFSLEDVKTIPEEEALAPFLPSTETQGVLEDLGSAVLEEIEPAPSTSSVMVRPEEALDESLVLNDPDVLCLLDPSEEKNLPLPGFSQTFQPPPPPKK